MLNELYELQELIYFERCNLQKEIEEYVDHEEYSIEEQRYDEGYDNALLWVSLEIGKRIMRRKKALQEDLLR